MSIKELNSPAARGEIIADVKLLQKNWLFPQTNPARGEIIADVKLLQKNWLFPQPKPRKG